MYSEPSPLLVLSDLHLKHSGERIELAFERVSRRHPGHELILAGDVLDLSDDPPDATQVHSIGRHLERHPRFARTLRERLAAARRVTWIPGNHDAGLAAPDVRAAILAKLGLNDDSPLTIAPWFVRRGAVHIEHGHLYDPDNAPAHPLAVWDPMTEPIGVALTRQFLSRRGAWIYAHAYETTPAAALGNAFREYGPRAPLMIYQYFDVAVRLCLRARRNRPMMDRQRETGDERVRHHAKVTNLPEEALHALLDKCTRPTHDSMRAAFMRLYFDRVLATLAVAGGAGAMLTGSPFALPLATAGALYLAGSIARSPHRIGTTPEQRMRDGAKHIRELTGASLVVLGHTHQEDEEQGYVNLGSFAFSNRGAPRYLLIGADGRACRRSLAAPAELHSAGSTTETTRRAASVYEAPL